MTVKSLAQKLMRATAKENQVSQIFLDYFFVAFFSIRKLNTYTKKLDAYVYKIYQKNVIKQIF